MKNDKEYKIMSMLNGLIIIVVASSQLQAIQKVNKHFNHDVRVISRDLATI